VTWSPNSATAGRRTEALGGIAGAEHVRFWWDTDYPGLTPGSPEDFQRTHEAQAAEEQLRQQCLDHYPLDSAQRSKRATTVIDAAPPVEPATPGWPDTN